MVEIARTVPPEYCQYAGDRCDNGFDNIPPATGMFLYASEPPQIAATIEASAAILKRGTDNQWLTWRDLQVAGTIVFCTICKQMRFSSCIIADVTTLNFNLMFEIGVALGLELPLIPIRDASFIRDKRQFDELGLLDTLGYLDFQNSGQLSDAIRQRLPVQPIRTPPVEMNLQAPLYVLKGPHQTEGEVRLFSEVKKSVVHFRSYDPYETPRISLHELRKQVQSSVAVIAHLVSPDRVGSQVHNARCALAAGAAMAQGKAVLMLQEGRVQQPIDYRDIVACYDVPEQISLLVRPILLHTIQKLQDVRLRSVRPPEGLLQKMDIGDLAAENEIRSLRSYFVETGQYHQASRGHARLVVGRKGSGKTAIFYALRDSLKARHSRMFLDLKPEGHQFQRLKEAILSALPSGVQEHTLTALWDAILMAELAHKIKDEDGSWAMRDRTRQDRYDKVVRLYEQCWMAEEGDFSERLLKQVNRITADFEQLLRQNQVERITETIFRGDMRQLRDAVAAYLEQKEEVWVLVDNLDKGWPIRGATTQDIAIIRTLLEATRKLQRDLGRRNVELHCLVFLRNDIYEHLVLETPDKGKDTAISLDWTDPEMFKQLFRLRALSTGLIPGDANFDHAWGSIFDAAVGTQDAFAYMLERTLMRPRDLLMFLHGAIEVAINRQHQRVGEADILKAEDQFSEDMLKALAFELRDILPKAPDFVYGFIGCPTELEPGEAVDLVAGAGGERNEAWPAVELLVWFGFLGVRLHGTEDPRYSYDTRYDLMGLLAPIKAAKASFVIHAAFRKALGCVQRR